MKRAGTIFRKLLYPPRWVLVLIPPCSFAALGIAFASGNTESLPAYGIYGASAYSLAIWLAALPGLLRRFRAFFGSSRPVRRIRGSRLGEQYLHDPAFRGSVNLYQGLAVNLFFVIFRTAAGIRYRSVWFLSIAAYYLVLGGLRAYLIVCGRRGSMEAERRCYRTTAWLLFLLNLPMGGMILLMVKTNSGFSYPGYIIYLSALHAFYTMTVSVINLVKFRRLGSPVLSAAKVLNLVSAMMSVLALQTAMIAQFSQNGETYRRMMNTITGSAVYLAVILTAAYMLCRKEKSP